MVRYFALFFFSSTILVSCDDTPKRVMPRGKVAIIAEKEFPKEKEAPIDIPPPPAPYTGPKNYCFEMELGANTNEISRMQFLLDDNDSINGRLDFSFANKPAIHGIVEGLKQGKIIELNYSYIDSGKQKTEDMVLKLEDDKLYKKTGALVEENGIMVLENPLKASLQLFMIKVDCRK